MNDIQNIKLPARMGSASNTAQSGHSRFMSIKTPYPVFYRRRWHLYGVRLLSLDPKVVEIQNYSGADVPQDAESVLKVRLAEGEIIVGFSRYPIHDLFCGQMPFQTLTRTLVEAEPRFTNLKSIWSTANSVVNFQDKIRILMAVNETPEGVNVEDLLHHVRWGDSEPVHVILKLIVEGELTFDLSTPFRPSTKIFAVRESLKQNEIIISSSNKISENSEVTDCRTPQNEPRILPKKTRNHNQIEMLMPINFESKNAAPSTGIPSNHGASGSEHSAEKP